ncbi:hypothetical protein KC573_03305, partial [candidate division WWE3 bacterium]|nr:hypothetical protein [candidate division WWE3 bacterium]
NFRWVGIILAMVVVVAGVIYGLQLDTPELPPVGRAIIDLLNTDQENAYNFEIKPFFFYCSAPQYYNVNLETVELRTLIVNPTESSTSEQVEIKAYLFTELWDTRTHGIMYDQRTQFINGQPKDSTNVFSEEELRAIVNQSCTDDSEQTCYNEQNPNDNNNTFGGFQLEEKPSFVDISDPIELTQNERYTYIINWTPTECGYYQIVVQPFGYTEAEEKRLVQDAYIRVIGCDTGEIIDNGVVEGVSDDHGSSDPRELPGTASGLWIFIMPAIGVLIGGFLMQVSLRSIKINE